MWDPFELLAGCRRETGQTRLGAVAMLQPRAMLVLVGIAFAFARQGPADAQAPTLAVLPSSRNYITQRCDGVWQKYEPLISASLAPYQTRALSVDTILNLHGWTHTPQVIVVNNAVMTFGDPALNAATGLVPLLVRISKLVSLPPMVVAGDIMDLPEDDVDRHGGPWFGFCNIVSQTTNLLYSVGPPVHGTLTCGETCTAFHQQDQRQNKAIFLGSSTGWHRGKRRAAVIAGMKHTDRIHSGFTQLIDIDQHTRESQDPALNATKPHLTMLEQVQQYKYIIVADGHCATIRMRFVLASDSVVFWMVSDMIEWFYPLLQPYVHYVPIRFDVNNDDVTANDILAKLQWAESNPAQMSAINREAKLFAKRYLSEHGSTCYSVQLFDEYSRLFPDSATLFNLAASGAFNGTTTQEYVL